MDYRLDELGWFQFERLCQALLRSAHGASLETWGGSRDMGKDAYADGPLDYPNPEKSEAGPFVFQVKFVEAANASGSKPSGSLMRAVQLERDRIKERLAGGQWRQPRFFTLMTNVTLTPRQRKSVGETLEEVLSESTILLTGGTEISAMLDTYPQLRLSYPQVLGLRDLRGLLQGIVAADVITRSTFALESAERLARVFVPTDAYSRALTVLSGKGFVVLTGPPEMGKTATARMIALARHSAGWEVYDCRHPDELLRTYDRERSQVFLADDAFGSTEYRPEIATEWAAVLDRLIDMADYRHNILWTSRPAPLKEGLRQLHLQGSARDFPQPSEVQVDASRLSVPEKAQMLYRHAKAGELTNPGLALIRKNARRIVNSSHFTPLRIERFVNEQLPKILAAPAERRAALIDEAIERGLKAPTKAMQTSFEALNEEQKAILFAMLSVSSGESSMEAVRARVTDYLGHPSKLSVDKLAEMLDEHFLRVATDSGSWPNR